MEDLEVRGQIESTKKYQKSREETKKEREESVFNSEKQHSNRNQGESKEC